MTFDTQNDPFMEAGGGSNPSLKFPEIGDKHTGVVIGVRKQVDTKPDGTVKTWDSGEPMHVFIFDLDIDGETHSLWVRGNMVTAVREAANAAGVKTLVGQQLTIQHYALGEAKKGFNAPKLFRAKVEPAPVKAAASAEPAGDNW
jgi:hypothetical protein